MGRSRASLEPWAGLGRLALHLSADWLLKFPSVVSVALVVFLRENFQSLPINQRRKKRSPTFFHSALSPHSSPNLFLLRRPSIWTCFGLVYIFLLWFFDPFFGTSCDTKLKLPPRGPFVAFVDRPLSRWENLHYRIGFLYSICGNRAECIFRTKWDDNYRY